MERPLGVMPGRDSRRRDLRGGKEQSVVSVKEGAGKDETRRFSRDGRALKTSMNKRESIVPPGLQWRMSV